MTARKMPAQMISPDAYPQMIGKDNAARAMQTLRSAQTGATAQAAMEAAAPPMRAAILQYVEALEAAGGDLAQVFDIAHEVRGVAGTAGLVTTGRIADILCRYMDELQRLGKPLDIPLVLLHVAAIGQASRARDDDGTGQIVAAELSALVARRLLDAQGA